MTSDGAMAGLEQFARGRRGRRIARAMESAVRTKAGRPESTLTDDAARLSVEGDGWDPDAIMAFHKLDPADWVIKHLKPIQWMAGAVIDHEWVGFTLHRLGLDLEPKAPPLPDDFFGFKPLPWKPSRPRPERLAGRPQLFMLCGDLQVPYYDRALHELSCRMAHDLKIDRWYDLGDEFDLPSLGRWQPRRPRWPGDEDFYVGVKATMDAGRQVFSDRTSAVVDYCELHLVDSNHLERWETYILNNAPALFGAIPHIRDMAGLPAMGWQVHCSNYGSGTYQMAEVEILPGVIGIHGYEAKGYKRGGDSVRVELDQRVNTHVFQAHCNHQAHVQLVRGGVGDAFFLQHGFEVGMLGQRRMAYGGRKVKDWQQGLTMLTVWPSGAWQAEQCPYSGDRTIRFRDQEWRV